MKKYLFMVIVSLLMISPVFASPNIAVVDLQKLVSSSAQVKQLKQEHSKKISELDNIIKKARAEISNEKDAAKVLLIEEKYTNEFNTKKETLEKEYNKKLSDIEQNIKHEILKKATKDSYDFVFAKSVVLYGGTDITNELQGNIK